MIMKICDENGILCVLHNFVGAALELKATAIHLPLPILRNMSPCEKKQFKILGASCHSLDDAKEAENLGCTYIMAGHIFDTDCKKGVPSRGLVFLKRVCESVTIPVYAIGGISPSTYESTIKAGAFGACIMSGFMLCENPVEYIKKVKK